MFTIFARNPRREVGSSVDYTSLKFSGGEIQVRISNWNTQYDHVTITANLTDSDKIMELANLVDAFRRIDPTVKLHLICPYLPYARQDRVCADGESLALRVMTDMINSLNFESVEVWDVHSDVSLALVNRVHNVGAQEFLDSVLSDSTKKICLIAPDSGAAKSRVPAVAKKYKLPMLIADKHRDPLTGEITGTQIAIPSEFYSHTFLMIDDICDGGWTFIKLANAITSEVTANGNRVGVEKPTIELYVTHGIFSKTLDVLTEAGISHVYTTNPFPAVNLENPHLTVLEKR